MGIICVLENPVFLEDVGQFQKRHHEDDAPNVEEHLVSYISNRFQIYEIVLSLRRQRNCGTVQTAKQYEFIYTALKDEIMNPVPKEAIVTILRPPLLSPPRPATENIRSPRTSRGHWTCRSEVGQVGHMSFAEQFNAQHN